MSEYYKKFNMSFYKGSDTMMNDMMKELVDLEEKLSTKDEIIKELKECVELILESKPVEDILDDKNKMFCWNMGLIVKARETLNRIKELEKSN